MASPEQIWQDGLDLRSMLEGLPDRPSARKLRLFALACCRRCGHLLADPRSVAAVEFAERYAEVGTARRKGRPAVLRGAYQAWQEPFAQIYSTDGALRSAALAATFAAAAAYCLLAFEPWESALSIPEYAAKATACGRLGAAGLPPSGIYGPRDNDPDHEEQVRLLRDVLGDPFAPVEVEPAWLTGGGGAAARIVQGIAEEGAYERLPVLADALEDAGCTSAALLAHCRDPGPHVRGCWVVDLLTGRS